MSTFRDEYDPDEDVEIDDSYYDEDPLAMRLELEDEARNPL